MNFLYIISIFILFILICMIKKSEKKLEIIPTTIILILCMLVYQVLVCWLFSTLNISITLLSVSICNILLNLVFVALLIKNGFQKYTINKKDSIVTLLLFLVIAGIIYKDVGIFENIRYYSTDASIHYIAAREFYENDKMLNKTENTETAKEMMPMAYVNVGMLFKAFEPIVGQMNFYKIFLIFDVTIFLFSAILFYFIIKEKIENKWHTILAVILSIIYLCGYPLNNILNGFYYLGIGCLMANAILWLILYKEKFNKVLERIILCLLNIGLILSYALFAPVIYGSIFIYKIYNIYKNNKKIINKEIILDTIIELVIPGLLGVTFLLLPDIKRMEYISLDGYIYKNLFINIVFFIPFVAYFYFKKIKERKLNYIVFYFITLILYMIILYTGTKTNIVSEYYFYKNAYLLWSVLLISFFFGLTSFIKQYPKEKVIAIMYVVVYVFLFTVGIFSQKQLLSIYDIYNNNNSLIIAKENLVQEDVKILSYIYDNNLISKTENNILFIGDFMQEAWIRSMFKYRNRYPLEKANHLSYIEKWNNNETPYLVCFENSNTYKRIKESINFENKKLIFETENSKIYEN